MVVLNLIHFLLILQIMLYVPEGLSLVLLCDHLLAFVHIEMRGQFQQPLYLDGAYFPHVHLRGYNDLVVKYPLRFDVCQNT